MTDKGFAVGNSEFFPYPNSLARIKAIDIKVDSIVQYVNFTLFVCAVTEGVPCRKI